MIEDFEKRLKGKYCNELLTMFEKEIPKEAQKASNRRDYEECGRLLNRMKKPGNQERAVKLVADFR